MAAAPVAAQPIVAPAESAGDALSRNLRTLAANPRSLHALMGAGQAALTLGDAQAALTFFGRAEEQAPRDGRIKMWMGSALVQLGQPQAALNFFRDALALGAPEADVARDRGLAFDLGGDPRRAQRDYQLVLRRGRDAEVTRRFALSLAISGERERAMQLLEEQLLVRDRAAERTRALVLALTGDADGAGRAVKASMPGPQAAAMAPFLARLPSLSAADRARAVHLGHFPGDGRTPPAAGGSYASIDPALRAGAPDSRQPSLARRAPSPEPVSTAPRRRPGTEAGAAATPIRDPGTKAATGGPAAAAGPPPAAMAGEPAAAAQPAPAQARAQAQAPTADPPPAPAPSASRLAEIQVALAAIEEPESPPSAAEGAPAARTPAPSPRRARATPATPSPAVKKPPPPAREPSRHWVQIAGGANRSTLPREFVRLKGKAPKQLGSRAAWTTPANLTNRLLVGPFANTREAQSFVNELAKADVAAFAWTSEAGQKVERLPAK